MCICVCIIYQWIFYSMDSIPIKNDNDSQCLSIDYISSTVAGASTHYLIEPTHWLHTCQPHIIRKETGAERSQATCPSLQATKYLGYKLNLNPGLAPKLPDLLWPIPSFQ